MNGYCGGKERERSRVQILCWKTLVDHLLSFYLCVRRLAAKYESSEDVGEIILTLSFIHSIFYSMFFFFFFVGGVNVM